MMGRPSLYRPEHCEQLVEHLAQGFSFESFAGIANVSRRTIYDWVDAWPDFKEAKEAGEAKGLLYWERIIRDPKAIHPSIWIFTMKNRFGWRDRSPEEEDERRDALGKSIAKNLTAEDRDAMRELAKSRKKAKK